MSFNRVNSNWNIGDKLIISQITHIDKDHSYSADKTANGDTVFGPWTLSGAGRVVPTVTTATDANSTVVVGGANAVLRFTSAITASRTYTLSATGVQTNDQIAMYAESSLANSIVVKDQGGDTLFQLGNGSGDDGPWATFIYISGWRLFQSSHGLRFYSQVFKTSGSWTAPGNVASAWVFGWGGGGGGGGGAKGLVAANSYPVGGGGGSGAIAGLYPLTGLTAGGSYTVTIGAGGGGGAMGSAGSAGGATTFAGTGANIRFSGGGGGYGGGAGSALGGQLTPGGFFSNGLGYGSIAIASSNIIQTEWPINMAMGGLSEAGCNGGIGGFTNMVVGTSSGGGVGGFAGFSDGSYQGGAGGAGGGSGPQGLGGAGGNGGNGRGISGTGVGNPGTAGGVANNNPLLTANSGAGGGGGGAGGAGAFLGGNGGAGGAGGSGQLTVVWVK